MSLPERIAIIGTGCRFQGGASTPSKLWELLREPRDLSRPIPSERFSVDGFYHSNRSHHGTTNVTNAYCIVEDFRHFDAQFFQTKTAEVFAMDPQQRILLETVYEAVEASGQRLEKLQGTNTAVFVGVMGGDFHDLKSQDLDSMPTYMSTGTARSILSNRISYFFDWHGPSMTIDTACSSSLVALHTRVFKLHTAMSPTAKVRININLARCTSRMTTAIPLQCIFYSSETVQRQGDINFLSPGASGGGWKAMFNTISPSP